MFRRRASATRRLGSQDSWSLAPFLARFVNLSSCRARACGDAPTSPAPSPEPPGRPHRTRHHAAGAEKPSRATPAPRRRQSHNSRSRPELGGTPSDASRIFLRTFCLRSSRSKSRAVIPDLPALMQIRDPGSTFLERQLTYAGSGAVGQHFPPSAGERFRRKRELARREGKCPASGNRAKRGQPD